MRRIIYKLDRIGHALKLRALGITDWETKRVVYLALFCLFRPICRYRGERYGWHMW